MPNAILVPLDTSILALNALPIARSLGRRTGRVVHLARVRRHVPGAADPTDSPQHASRRCTSRESLERNLEDTGSYFVAELGPQGVRTALLEGADPTAALATYAREQGIELIVMGARGLRSDGYARGMIAAAALGRQAKVPVLLIHPEIELAESAADRRFNRVLIALSGGEPDDQLVAAVDLINSAEPLHCTLVHVLHTSGEGSFCAANAYLQKHAAVLEARGHSAETRVLRNADVSSAIAATARRVNADLVITGAPRQSDSVRAGFGSVTTGVFSELRRPLLVVDPGPRGSQGVV